MKTTRVNRKDYNLENDYIMTSDLEEFDEFTIDDIVGIEKDLKNILFTPQIPASTKVKVKRRYNKVIEYIQDRIKEREDANQSKL